MLNGIFTEAEAVGKWEAMAREGICPSCRRTGFIGYGQDVGEVGGMVGVCLCKHCWTTWWYILAARRYWRVD